MLHVASVAGREGGCGAGVIGAGATLLLVFAGATPLVAQVSALSCIEHM